MMTLGFTYDLRDDYLAQGFSAEDAAEFDSQETIDAIEFALQQYGFNVAKIGNIKALAEALVAGKSWNIVFNICEGVKGIGREAQVPALLEAYGIPYVFSNSDVMVLTMNKALAKVIVQNRGIPTASFVVIETAADVATVDLPFPVFAKPLAEGTGKGISSKSIVYDKTSLERICTEITKKFHQPTLVETYLPGRDLTVGIVGSADQARTIAVMETFYQAGAEPGSQSLYNKENWKKVLSYAVVEDETAKAAADIALRSWRALGCLDGGRVDLRCDEQGIPNFLEVNAIAGLRPYHSDLPMLCRMVGIEHAELIHLIMDSALHRYGLTIKNKIKQATSVR
ncbi:MAG: D-alanine--D-alanine ligase [Nitrosomonadales bacterium]|jgi:D-alanine-D-alanine ligase|nr:MAG: D-alanine--D-alanine ligase [Nitrosomonadales bacterium]